MKVSYEVEDDILPWTFMSRDVHQASSHGRTNEIEAMSREGADLNDTDEMGNTPLWLAYLGGHLDTVFALLELNVDVNRRTGSILASDFHRACAWADEVFIDILCNYHANLSLTDRFGKTPLIYAIEYRDECQVDDELIKTLIERGSNVNHVDTSGLTALFYAIYRAFPSIVQVLLKNKADHKFENILGYSPLRYALGCLSYVQYHDGWVYEARSSIVTILLEKFENNELELVEALLGRFSSPTSVQFLFPLFDLIFYSRANFRFHLENFSWTLFERTSWPCSIVQANLLVAQNLVAFNRNFDDFIYFLQRMFIDDYQQLIVFYLQRVLKEKPTTNRFIILLYCAFVETKSQKKYVEILRSLLENQRVYLFKQRRETIRSVMEICCRAPIRLLVQCRQRIREEIRCAIDRRLTRLGCFSKSLEKYLLVDELSSFSEFPTNQRLFSLFEQSLLNVGSTVTNSKGNLSTKIQNFSSFSEFCV